MKFYKVDTKFCEPKMKMIVRKSSGLLDFTAEVKHWCDDQVSTKHADFDIYRSGDGSTIALRPAPSKRRTARNFFKSTNVTDMFSEACEINLRVSKDGRMLLGEII